MNSGHRILFFSRMDVHGYNVAFKNTKKFMSVCCMFVTLARKVPLVCEGTKIHERSHARLAEALRLWTLLEQSGTAHLFMWSSPDKLAKQFSCFFSCTTADLTWQAIGTPKSSSVAEKDFHLHTSGFEPRTFLRFKGPKQGL